MADSLLVHSEVRCFDFKDALVIPTAAGSCFWRKTLVKTAGSPTVAPSSNGVELAIDATSEAQAANLDNGDVLTFDIDDLIRLEGKVKLANATIDAGVDVVFGFAGAYNANLDTIAQSCWLKCAGSNEIVLETDDGTTNNDDKATGLYLKNEWRKFAIDFSVGILSQAPPAASAGGKASIRFSFETDMGQLMPVGETTNFSMADYAGALQLFAAVRKASGTGAETLYIKELEATYRI